MTLAAGNKLGPYEIVAPIGAGGMGDVYRARDPRVGREVAIKVSTEKFSERFEREARAVAALNHPNICTLYDVGPDYLVMELIKGETLAERIQQGAIPLEEALGIARQIADALEAAHEKGIIHRDLKPGNIKIRPDDTVKVLDFGLAKVAEIQAVSLSNSPTLSAAATQQGIILGTAAYMSPEQARGKPVDKRADIWAFGVVLYEMLTGRRLFEGDTVSDTLAAVLTRDPDQSLVPEKARRLLRTCLQRDPKQRLADISDAKLLLEDTPDSPAVNSERTHWRWPATVAIALIALAVALWAPWRDETPKDRPLNRLTVDLGEDVSLPAPRDGKNSIAISPEGTRIAYLSGNPPRIFTRRLDQPVATELPGTIGATACFFSPDGKWIGFPAGDKLNKISVEGGAVVPLGPANPLSFSGADWYEDGNILFSELRKGMLRISSSGGPSEAFTELEKDEMGHAGPQLLPGGKAVLFLTAKMPLGVDNINVEALTIADHRRKVLFRGGSAARYLPTSRRSGHLIYVNHATLFAVPFDPDKLEIRGTAVPILSDVANTVLAASTEYCVSDNGILVYRRKGGVPASASAMLQWIDPAGKKEHLLDEPGEYVAMHLSPDGRRLAFVTREAGRQDIWVYDIQRGAKTRLTSAGGVNFLPIWNPEGRYVIFGSYDGLLWARADGASQPQWLTQNQGGRTQIPWSVSKDGRWLAYAQPSESGNRQIWTLSLQEQSGQLKAGKQEPFLKSRFNDQAPAFSPDGRWLAYQSDDSGRDEVWVRPFPPPASGQGGRWQISNNGGTQPVWSRDGHQLLYRSGDQIMSVEYRAKGDAFEQEKPRVWIAKLGGTNWDLAPDGKRVAVITPVNGSEGPQADHEVVFLLNFFDELRRRVPAGAK